MHQIKPEVRRQDLEGIHLPTFRFSWKIKNLCRVDFFVFESWQTTLKCFPTLLPLRRPAQREKNTSNMADVRR
jgi:hypothetical protein